MKKLIFILFLLLISCGGNYQKQEAVSDDSLFVMMNTMDSINNLTPSYQDQILKSISMDSPINQPETLLVQKDTIKPSTRKMVETKLDTTSNLPMIRKNREVIDYQQKQIDSLLKKKK